MHVLELISTVAIAFGAGTPAYPAARPVDGPHPVVVRVPAMTCASCPERVAAALASLSWVRADSIHADRRTQQVKFAVTDPARFHLDKVREVIDRAGYHRTDLLVAPVGR